MLNLIVKNVLYIRDILANLLLKHLQCYTKLYIFDRIAFLSSALMPQTLWLLIVCLSLAIDLVETKCKLQLNKILSISHLLYIFLHA